MHAEELELDEDGEPIAGDTLNHRDPDDDDEEDGIACFLYPISPFNSGEIFLSSEFGFFIFIFRETMRMKIKLGRNAMMGVICFLFYQWFMNLL